MTCHNCRTKCQRFGRDRKGNQRFRCCQCYKTYSDRPERLEGTYLPATEIASILRLLVEGMSIRSIERITGKHHDTILNVLVLVGERCRGSLNAPCTNCRCVMYSAMRFGDSSDARKLAIRPMTRSWRRLLLRRHRRNTKLVITWHLGKRSPGDAWTFIRRLESATTGNFQATTDGWPAYPEPMLAYLRDRASLFATRQGVWAGCGRRTPLLATKSYRRYS